MTKSGHALEDLIGPLPKTVSGELGALSAERWLRILATNAAGAVVVALSLAVLGTPWSFSANLLASLIYANAIGTPAALSWSRTPFGLSRPNFTNTPTADPVESGHRSHARSRGAPMLLVLVLWTFLRALLVGARPSPSKT